MERKDINYMPFGNSSGQPFKPVLKVARRIPAHDETILDTILHTHPYNEASISGITAVLVSSVWVTPLSLEVVYDFTATGVVYQEEFLGNFNDFAWFVNTTQVKISGDAGFVFQYYGGGQLALEKTGSGTAAARWKITLNWYQPSHTVTIPEGIQVETDFLPIYAGARFGQAEYYAQARIQAFQAFNCQSLILPAGSYTKTQLEAMNITVIAGEGQPWNLWYVDPT